MPVLEVLKLFLGAVLALLAACIAGIGIMALCEFAIMYLNGSRKSMKRLDGDQYFDESQKDR
mgnify:CR=1 FL=1